MPLRSDVSYDHAARELSGFALAVVAYFAGKLARLPLDFLAHQVLILQRERVVKRSFRSAPFDAQFFVALGFGRVHLAVQRAPVAQILKSIIDDHAFPVRWKLRNFEALLQLYHGPARIAFMAVQVNSFARHCRYQ